MTFMRCENKHELEKSHFKVQVETALGRILGYLQRGQPKREGEDKVDQGLITTTPFSVNLLSLFSG